MLILVTKIYCTICKDTGRYSTKENVQGYKIPLDFCWRCECKKGDLFSNFPFKREKYNQQTKGSSDVNVQDKK